MRLRRVIEAAAIMAVAAVVRAPITSIPPQVQSLTSSLGLSASGFGLLTTIPLLCFAVAAPIPISRFAMRYTPDAAVVLSLAVLTGAILLRILGGTGWLFIGTALVGLSIAMLNVMAPAIVRRDYHARLTLVMPVYTAVLAIMASAGAWLSIPLSEATTHDWRGGTAPWAALAAAALLLWLPALRAGHRASGTTTATPTPLRALLHDPTAWAVSLYMGLQSSVFYSGVAWIPKLMQDWGRSEADAGSLLGYTTMAGFVFTLVVPFAVGRSRDQRKAVAVTAIAPVIGFIGLATWHSGATLLFLTLIGVGHAALAPALVLIGLRAHSVAQTAQLSAMAQGVGYLLASLAPVLLGMLHVSMGSWTLPLLVLAALSAMQYIVGMRAAHPRH